MWSSDFYGWMEELRAQGAYDTLLDMARTYWAHFPLNSYLGYEFNTYPGQSEDSDNWQHHSTVFPGTVDSIVSISFTWSSLLWFFLTFPMNMSRLYSIVVWSWNGPHGLNCSCIIILAQSTPELLVTIKNEAYEWAYYEINCACLFYYSSYSHLLRQKHKILDWLYLGLYLIFFFFFLYLISF